jgi:hypothetical protein
LLAVAALIAALVTLISIAAYRDEKILYDDAIEFVTLFGRTRFRVADLAGYRRRRIPSFPGAVAFHLVPKEANRRGRALVTIPGASESIDLWLSKLSDLEA